MPTQIATLKRHHTTALLQGPVRRKHKLYTYLRGMGKIQGFRRYYPKKKFENIQHTCLHGSRYKNDNKYTQ